MSPIVNDFNAWSERFSAPLKNRKQRILFTHYSAGLICDSLRKNMAEMGNFTVGPRGKARFQHFLSKSPWNHQEVRRSLVDFIMEFLGPADFFIIDDTSLLKKGEHSVGVDPQYAGCVGKVANSQSLVSVTLAYGNLPLPIALQLYMPESWTDSPERMDKARVPEEHRVYRTKPCIVLAEVDWALEAGVVFRIIVGDGGYGKSKELRDGLDARGLLWILGLPKNQMVYGASVKMVSRPEPDGKKLRGRKPHCSVIPDALPVLAESLLEQADWESVHWRDGTKGELSAEFAAVRVRLAEGKRCRLHGKAMQRMPGETRWLIGERRKGGEKKYYLSSLPPETDLHSLAYSLKARWSCEQAHQQLKQNLGLNHFEGRSYQGLCRHAVLAMVAYAFLQRERIVIEQRRIKERQEESAPEDGGKAQAGKGKDAAASEDEAQAPPDGGRPRVAGEKAQPGKGKAVSSENEAKAPPDGGRPRVAGGKAQPGKGKAAAPSESRVHSLAGIGKTRAGQDRGKADKVNRNGHCDNKTKWQQFVSLAKNRLSAEILTLPGMQKIASMELFYRPPPVLRYCE